MGDNKLTVRIFGFIIGTLSGFPRTLLVFVIKTAGFELLACVYSTATVSESYPQPAVGPTQQLIVEV